MEPRRPARNCIQARTNYNENSKENSIVQRFKVIESLGAEEPCVLQKMYPAIVLFASVVLATAQAPSAPGKPLPPGPMQAKVKAGCTGCHNVSRITEQHLSRQGWAVELDKMEGLGAVIPDADRPALLSYLSKNFGPAKGTPPKN
jgi:hypothetical protein